MSLVMVACAEPASQPEEAVNNGEVTVVDPEVALHRRWESGATIRWNRKAMEIFRSHVVPGSPPPNAGRINTYLALAQYRAVRAAVVRIFGPHRECPPSLAGASAGASAVILKQFYPADAAIIDAELAAQRADPPGMHGWHFDFEAGEAIGREVAAEVLALAATDNFGLAPLPPQPTGPGYWVSSGAPTVKGGFGARPFFLRSNDEINSPPPPVFGSPQLVAALQDIRALSDARTPEQVALTAKWVPFSAVVFNGIATDLLEKYHRGEYESARVLAYANAAAFDAIIGCFTSKFVYWYIRPTQADPGITLATGLPNHPSYPAAHSCESGAFQAVLSATFPRERRAIGEAADEASFSRNVGGLHYRFDTAEGQALGRRAGALALRRRGLE